MHEIFRLWIVLIALRMLMSLKGGLHHAKWSGFVHGMLSHLVSNKFTCPPGIASLWSENHLLHIVFLSDAIRSNWGRGGRIWHIIL